MPRSVEAACRNRSAAAHRLLQLISAGRGIHVANAVPVYRPSSITRPASSRSASRFDSSEEPNCRLGESSKTSRRVTSRSSTKLLSVGLAEARRDVPVDVPNVVAELVLDDLVELHAASAEGRAILAAEHILHSMAHAPLHPPEKGKG